MTAFLCRLLTLCLLPAGAAAQPAPAPVPPAPAPLVVQLDWHLNAQFAGLLVAAAEGLYRTEGLDVALRPLGPLPYDRLVDTVAATDGMIGSSEGGLFLAGRARGLPVVAIGTMFQASPLGLISLESAGIRTPADLAGRRVAIHDDGHEALDTVLQAAGLDRKRVAVSVAAGHGPEALLAGKIDAQQGYLVDELVKLRLAGHAVQALEYRHHGLRAYSQVYFVSERTLARHREDLRRFLRASGLGWQKAVAGIPATAALIRTRHSPDLASPYLEASLRLIATLLTAEQPTLGAMQRATWVAQAAAVTRLRPESATALRDVSVWADFSLAGGTP